MKLFSTQTHGVLDYSSVVMLYVLPRALAWSSRVTWLLTGSALATLVYSLATRYELGVFKRISMPIHLLLDRVSGFSLFGSALALKEEPQAVRLALLGLGLFEVTASLTTETAPR